jgi:hypothetical protein
MKLEKILGKHSNAEFHENPSSEKRVVAGGWSDGGGQTGRDDEDNSTFSQF